MSTTYIDSKLRRLVKERANYRCEYCRINENDSYWGCHIDHIISEKHDGETVANNLALACAPCNRNKGTDLGSVLTGSDTLIRFFNPRTDNWDEHFRLDGITIIPRTDIGTVTEKIFGLNAIERLLEREELIDLGRYP